MKMDVSCLLSQKFPANFLVDKFKGIFIKGKREGQGILTDPNGNYFEGLYVDNKQEGSHKYTNIKTKTVTNIMFKNGKKVE